MIEFYRIDTYVNESGNLIWSFLINLIGTLLGFIGAFWIAMRVYKKQVKKEETKQIDRYKDRLMFVSELIKSSIKTINGQLENFEDLGRRVKEDPLNYHELGIIASNDLDRLQKMDTAEVFYAYNYLVPQSPHKANDYPKIYSNIDYLYLRLKQGISSADKQVMYVHRDQMSFKKIVDDLANKIFVWIKYYENTNSAFDKLSEYNFLVEFHKIYIFLSQEKKSIQLVEEVFIVPFGKNLYAKFQTAMFFSELFSYTHNAQVTLNHIKENSHEFSNEMIDIKRECIDKINFLVDIIEKLKTK